MQAYGLDFVSGHRILLLVTGQNSNLGNGKVYFNSHQRTDTYQKGSLNFVWICRDMHVVTDCRITQARQRASTWSLNDVPIDYCISQKVEPHCKLSLSTTLMAVVVVMNAMKAACMFWILLKVKVQPLTTFGDAVASFLNQPDKLTSGRCLMSKKDVGRGPLRWRMRAADVPGNVKRPIRANTARSRGLNPGFLATTQKLERLLVTGTQWMSYQRLQAPKVPRTDISATAFERPRRKRWFSAASFARWFFTLHCSAQQ